LFNGNYEHCDPGPAHLRTLECQKKSLAHACISNLDEFKLLGRQVGSVDCNITVGKICRTEPYFSFGDNIKNDKIVSDCIEENGSIWGVISISKCIQIVLVDCGI
jgi:hypothetical protein